MSDDEWAGMCKTLERPDWVSDPRFSSTSARFENAEVRIRETGKILRKRTSAEWLEMLDANGVPCAPVLTRTEMLNNPQVVNNDIIEEYGHPVIGTVRQARGATRFGSAKNHSSPVAPGLGQHNAEILKEIGYADEEISKLRSDKIIYSSD
jgi:crotonobetainyl-CoA:carnitine CoA-transferase CaiB-like acyl-CoA transferase